VHPVYVVFPGSHAALRWPLSQAQIDAEGAKLMAQFALPPTIQELMKSVRREVPTKQ
jgi:hypothetical protein